MHRLTWLAMSSLALMVRAPGVASGQPVARSQPGVAVLDSTVIVFGGQGADGSVRSDTWICDSRAWRAGPARGPQARVSHAMAGESRGRALLYGGFAGGERLGDTWLLDEAGWVRWAGTGPGARSAHALSYDPVRKRVVMFGGSGREGLLGDTWEWDGDVWRQVATTGPTPRRNHALAYASSIGAVILFGGSDQAGKRADTWAWDGVRWRELDHAGPTSRDHHAMASGQEGGVALFGGWDGDYLADLWRWSPAGWLRLNESGPPRAGRPSLIPSAGGWWLVGGADRDGPAGSHVYRADRWSPGDGCAAHEQSPTRQLQADLKAAFVRKVDDAASNLDGVAGWIVTDLTTREVVTARNERLAFPPASTIKLAILYELLKQAEAGTLKLDERVALDRSQVVSGSGVLQHLTTPALSLRDHAALMIIVSDNTSTNVVIDAVGMARVNARMAALGFSDILLRRKMMDAAAAARGDENVASPASLAAMAERLWRGDGLSGESKAEAHRILRRVSGQIRSAVPGSVAVYEKTGSLTGVRAEAAVVVVEGRPFSIAVMTTYLGRDDDGNRLVREIAAAAFSYFDRLAKGGPYGRR